MPPIGSMEVVLSADAAALLTALDRIEKRMTKAEADTNKHAQGMAASFGRVTRVLQSAQTVFVGWVAAVGASRLIGWFNQASEEVDRLGKAAKRLGLTSEEMSGLRFAAKEAGIEFNQLATLVGRAGKAVAEIVEKGQTVTKIGAINVRLTDAEGNVRSIADLLPELARGIESAGSQAEQLNLATKLFGKGGGDAFVTLLKDGGRFVDNLANQLERARRLGVVFTEDQVEKLTAYNDAVGRIDESLLGLRVNIMTRVAPALGDLANEVAGVVAAVPDAISKLMDLIRDMLGARGAEMQSAAIEKVDMIFGALANTTIAGVEFVFRVATATIIDGVKVLPNLVGPVVTGAFVEIFMSGMGEAQRRVAGLLEGMFPELAAEMVRRVDAGMEAARKNLVESTAEDINAAIGKLATGGLISNQWRAGIAGINKEGGRLVELLDKTLDIGDLLAKHAMTGFEKVSKGAATTTQAISELQERLAKMAAEGSRVIEGFASSAGDALADFAIDGKSSIEDLARSWSKTLLSMAAQALVFQPLFRSLGAGFGKLFAQDGTQQIQTDVANSAIGFAHGGVAEPRGFIHRAANGLIMKQRTFLPQLNTVAAEAGNPEVAFAPLRRVGGDLGVKSAPANVTVQVLDQRGSGARPQVSEHTGPDGQKVIRVMIRDEMNRALSDGSADRVMGDSYGLRRRGAGR